jgi:hypothetical protein
MRLIDCTITESGVLIFIIYPGIIEEDGKTIIVNNNNNSVCSTEMCLFRFSSGVTPVGYTVEMKDDKFIIGDALSKPRVVVSADTF